MKTSVDWALPELLVDLVDFAFRPICLVCREPVARRTGGVGEEWRLLLCTRCEDAVAEIREPFCPRCGSPATPSGRGSCRMCERLPDGLVRIRSATRMDGVSETLVHRFKYQGWRDLAGFLAMKILSSRWSDHDFWEADLLVPVPISRVRRRERGYNQSALLAERLSGIVGIPTSLNALERIEWNRPQVGLPFEERMNNVQNAFSVPARFMNAIADRRVILVDDVVTTGATVVACHRALVRAGAERVSCVSFGRVDTGIDTEPAGT